MKKIILFLSLFLIVGCKSSHEGAKDPACPYNCAFVDPLDCYRHPKETIGKKKYKNCMGVLSYTHEPPYSGLEKKPTH